jgi:hypothetical protein
LDGNHIEKADDSSTINELIIPTHEWYIPIRVKGKYLYHVKVINENGMYRVIGCGESVLGFDVWDKVREKYPEESNVRPIVIGSKDQFVYFPNNNDRNKVFYVRNPKWNSGLSKMTSKSIDSLDDESKIIQYWKTEWENTKEERRIFNEKNPNLFKDNTEGGIK